MATQCSDILYVAMRLRLHSDSLYVATCIYMRLHSDALNEAQATQRHTTAMRLRLYVVTHCSYEAICVMHTIIKRLHSDIRIL